MDHVMGHAIGPCRWPGCAARALHPLSSVFQLCQQHVDDLSVYVNRKPVWSLRGVTGPSAARWRGAKRRFGWVLAA